VIRRVRCLEVPFGTREREARRFYDNAGLAGLFRVGSEARDTRPHWFEELLAELGHELLMGGRGEDPGGQWWRHIRRTPRCDALTRPLREGAFSQTAAVRRRARLAALVCTGKAGVDAGSGENQLHHWPWGGRVPQEALFIGEGLKELEGLALVSLSSYRLAELRACTTRWRRRRRSSIWKWNERPRVAAAVRVMTQSGRGPVTKSAGLCA